MGMRIFSVCLLLAPLASAQQPDLADVLAKLAANQEKAVEMRAAIVYQQDTFVRLLRSGSKVSRQEKRRYTVTPTPTGTNKEMISFEGKYEKGGKLYPYDKPGFQYKDTDIDGELIEDLTNDLVNDKKSRDGFSVDLFPLTAAEQAHYDFRLEGRRKVAGVEAIRISFRPKKEMDDDRPWAGEVLVHPTEFQPILVTTKLAFDIPIAVKIALGTNIKQLGFEVGYKKIADGLWFPVSYGTEFGFRVLFVYARNITMSVANTEFKKADVNSTIQFDPVSPE
jgi:hypothetical protein